MKQKKALKSVWTDKPLSHFSYFCPLCAAARRLNQSPKINEWVLAGRALVSSMFITLLVWPWLGLKGMVALLPIWVFLETFARFKLRQSLVCEQCGFDPALFLLDKAEAKAKVKTFFAQRAHIPAGQTAKKKDNRNETEPVLDRANP